MDLAEQDGRGKRDADVGSLRVLKRQGSGKLLAAVGLEGSVHLAYLSLFHAMSSAENVRLAWETSISERIGTMIHFESVHRALRSRPKRWFRMDLVHLLARSS